MHRHDNPRAIIVLEGGTLRVVNDAGETHDMTWETGSAYWLEADPPGELHGDVNEGPEPIEVIVVQLKGVASSASSVARLVAADALLQSLLRLERRPVTFEDEKLVDTAHRE